MDYTRILKLALFCVASMMATPMECIDLAAKVGENTILWRGLSNNTQVILSCKNAVLLNFDHGSKDKIADNIDMKNGSIIMVNVQMSDSNVYELQVYNSVGQRRIYDIRLNVTEPTHQIDPFQPTEQPITLENKGRVAVWISVVLVVLVLAIAAYWKRKWLREKMSHGGHL